MKIYDGVSKRHHGEDLAQHDISSFDRGVVSAEVHDGRVSDGSAVPLHSVRDGVTDVALALLANDLIKKNIRLSNNLVVEFGERKSPLADLSLELCIDGGGVGHVDWGAGEGDDTTLPSLMFLLWVRRILRRPVGSGIPMLTSWSNRLKTVSSTSTSRVTVGLGNQIQLVEEHHARSSDAGLVEDITDIGFEFALGTIASTLAVPTALEHQPAQIPQVPVQQLLPR